MSANKYIKGFLEDIVLQMIRENGKMYGYQITQKVKEITSGEMSFTEGALYPVLHKLESKGALEVSYEKVAGRTRKYYALTPQGGVLISETKERLTHFINSLNVVFNLPNNKI